MSFTKPTLQTAIFTVLFVVVVLLTIIFGTLGYLENRITVSQFSLSLVNQQRQSINQALANKFRVQSSLDQLAAATIGNLYDEKGMGAVDDYLLDNLKHFDEVSATFFSTRDNHFSGYLRQKDYIHMYANQTTQFAIEFARVGESGRDEEIINRRAGFFASQRPWYQSALDIGTSGFSDVFTYHAYATLALPHSLPVYSKTNQLLGVVGSNIFLGEFGGFLIEQMRPYNGVVVILDNKDRLIATSLDFSPMISEENRSTMINAKESDSAFVRLAHQLPLSETASSLQGPELVEMKVGDVEYRTASFPFSEVGNLNWKVTIFVPEQAFHKSVNQLLWQIASALLVSLLVALILGMWLMRGISHPITSLISRFSRAVETEHEPSMLEHSPYELKEVGELKDAIMRYQQSLSQYVQSLQEKVSENQQQLTQIQQLAVVSQSIDDMSIILGSGFRIVWANQPFLSFFAVDEQAAFHTPIHQVKGLAPEKRVLLDSIYTHIGGLPDGVLPPRLQVSLDEKLHFECRFYKVSEESQGSVLVLVRDISEQMAYEEALHIWKRIFDATKMGIAISWRNNQYIDIVNPAFAEMYGGTVEDYVGFDIQHFYPEEERGKPDNLRKLADEQGELTTEVEHVRRNGERFPVLLSVTFVRNDEGKVLGRVTALSDLTEPKQLQQELFQSQKMHAIGSLAGGIVHDMNNVLGAILGNAELGLLYEKFPNKTRAKTPLDLFEEIITAAQRGSKLTQQIMSFSRMERMKMETVCVQKLLNETVAIVQATLTKSIQLDFASSLTDRDAIMANESQLQQVFLNLLNNAVKAVKTSSPEAGLIRLIAKIADDGRMYIAICDNGCGIPKANQPFIFDPFFTTEPKGKGTGLGLAIVKRIVEAHHGEIVLQSEEAKGTCFELWFDGTLPEAGEQQHEDEAEVATNSKARLVIVDDDQAILSVWTQLLTYHGYQVTPFNDAREALVFIQEHGSQVDCLFTDYDMPNLNGEGLCEAIREHNDTLKIIMATGFSEALSKRKIEELHIGSLLLKPIAFNDLLKELERVTSVSSDVAVE